MARARPLRRDVAEGIALGERDPDTFPGFFHMDLENNVLAKLKLLRQFGFYPNPTAESQAPAQVGQPGTDSCGAHSPRMEPQNLATRSD